MVRFNTSDGVFEGYSGNAWASLGGVKDVDQDTFIEAESSPGADNDELKFVTAGITAFTVGNDQAITTGASTDLVFNVGGNIDVSNTVITGLAEPIANSDAVTKFYEENTFDRDFNANLLSKVAWYNLRTLCLGCVSFFAISPSLVNNNKPVVLRSKRPTG